MTPSPCNELIEALRARDEWRDKFERLEARIRDSSAPPALCCWEDCDQEPIYCREHYEQEQREASAATREAAELRGRVELADAVLDDLVAQLQALLSALDEAGHATEALTATIKALRS